MEEAIKGFRELLEIMDKLREECPWDKKQTIKSLRHLTIEETYELSEAIFDNNYDEIKKELGDLMLHIVFYSKIGSEQGAFEMKDVFENINQKLITRHPHIFGDVVVKDAKEVADNWEKIKISKEGRKSALEGVPQSLPPLVKAYRMQEKAAGIGFDWEEPHQVYDKVLEEMDELQVEIDKGTSQADIEGEFGDLLFALINYSRFINVNPEDALERTNRKFKSRFEYLECEAKKIGKTLSDMTLAEMDVYWEKAKTFEL